MVDIVTDKVFDIQDSKQDTHHREGEVQVVEFGFRESGGKCGGGEVKQVLDHDGDRCTKHADKEAERNQCMPTQQVFQPGSNSTEILILYESCQFFHQGGKSTKK